MATPSGGPQLTWFNIIVTLGMVVTAASGAWILFQAQMASLEKQFVAADQATLSRLNELRSIVINNQDKDLRLDVHGEFAKRVDGALHEQNERIRNIEASRPTTGELQAIGITVKDQLTEIKERIRSLEDNLRRPQSSPLK